MFSTPTLHHYMESCIIIRHYAILSGIAIEKQAVFTKTQAVNIIYILRKNFKPVSPNPARKPLKMVLSYGFLLFDYEKQITAVNQ